MKQLFQSLSDGNIDLIEIPVPCISDGEILVRSHRSLISTGTEKMLIDFGKSNFINKIKSQPDKVQEVISKVKNDGLLSTYEAVKHKLDEPFSLGYCSSGEVIQSKCEIFSIGDRVATNGPRRNICCSKKLGN